MRITARIQGDYDMNPVTKTFEYGGRDGQIMAESARVIRDHMANNMRLNVNQALEMYAIFIMTSLEGGGVSGGGVSTADEIRGGIRRLLSAHQVMIGVPESLRKVRFVVTDDLGGGSGGERDNGDGDDGGRGGGGDSRHEKEILSLTVMEPITVRQYVLREGRRTP